MRDNFCHHTVLPISSWSLLSAFIWHQISVIFHRQTFTGTYYSLMNRSISMVMISDSFYVTYKRSAHAPSMLRTTNVDRCQLVQYCWISMSPVVLRFWVVLSYKHYRIRTAHQTPRNTTLACFHKAFICQMVILFKNTPTTFTAQRPFP